MAEPTTIETTPGYIVVDIGGQKTMYPIKLTVAEIPTLTYLQVGAIKSLANHVAILIRTLIARGVLDESFMEEGDYDLATIVQSIEDMGGSYIEPDITVT